MIEYILPGFYLPTYVDISGEDVKDFLDWVYGYRDYPVGRVFMTINRPISPESHKRRVYLVEFRGYNVYNVHDQTYGTIQSGDFASFVLSLPSFASPCERIASGVPDHPVFPQDIIQKNEPASNTCVLM